MDKVLSKGCEVYMNSNSGCVGYGNIQCVKGVCESLGEVSLYGHNQSYKIYDIREIVSSPNQEKRIEAIAFAEWMAIRGYKRSKWYQDRWYIPTTPQIVETNQPSTEQLYELFQKSK